MRVGALTLEAPDGTLGTLELTKSSRQQVVSKGAMLIDTNKVTSNEATVTSEDTMTVQIASEWTATVGSLSLTSSLKMTLDTDLVTATSGDVTLDSATAETEFTTGKSVTLF